MCTVKESYADQAVPIPPPSRHSFLPTREILDVPKLPCPEALRTFCPNIPPPDPSRIPREAFLPLHPEGMHRRM